MTATPTDITKPAEAVAPPATEQAAPASPHDRHFRTDHLMADLKGRSVRGGAVTLSAQAVKFVLQTGSTMVLARLLTPADFGLIAMVSTFTGFVSLFKDLGLSMATIQRPDITHAQVSTLFWINVALSLALAALAAALAPAVAWFYNEPALTWITIAIAATFVFGGLSAQHTALLCRQMRFKALALIEITSLAVGVATAIALAWYTRSYWALVAMTGAQAATTAAMSFAVSGWVPGKPQRKAGTRNMVRFGGEVTGFNVLNYWTRNADNIIVGKIMGDSILGIYSKAYHLLMMPIRQINAPLTSVMLPALSRLHNDPVKYRRYYLRTLTAIAAVTMPIVASLFVLAHDAILVMLGEQWLAAVPTFRWLAPAALAGCINFAPGWLCLSLGRTRIQLQWAMLSAPITVLAFLIGVNWGINGVAAAFSLSWCILMAIFLRWACHGSPVRFRNVLGALMFPFFACSVAGGATALLVTLALDDVPPLVRLACGLLIFGTVYSAMLYTTATGRDLIDILSTILNKRRKAVETSVA